MSCKGICPKYYKHGTYLSGKKHCSICEINIQWEGLWCPCCGYRLRSKPRASKDKQRYAEINGSPKRY
ncbi:MAG: hypothetical protein KGI08_08395 [Thaumarchaeota archaeon]|nr:hypothetical protein [Nitrososphaerota archaeon]